MRRGLTSFVLAILMISFTRGEVISIGAEVEVSSDQISLGDIAQILPANPQIAGVPVGYAPYPGHHRWITKPDIEKYLHKWGWDQKVELRMDERVLITRESQHFDPEVIRQEVHRFLTGLNPNYKISIHEIQIPKDLFLPNGPIQMSIDPPASITRLNGLSLKLDFRSDGERLRSQWVRVTAVAEGPVVVANRDIPYGQPLRASDLEIEVRQFDRLEDFFSVESEVIGSVAKRSLGEGEILTQKDLKEAILVNRGDVVTVLVRGASFMVSALGKSRDSGSRGDAVVIENLDSKKLVHATVVGSKTVEVVIAGGAR